MSQETTQHHHVQNTQNNGPAIGLIMGSDSDWETVKPAVEVFAEFAGVCETSTPTRREVHRGVRRRCRSFAGYGGCGHSTSRDRDSPGTEKLGRAGFFAVYRADARRSAGGYGLD